MSFSHMYSLNRAKNAFQTDGGYSGSRYDDTYNETPSYPAKAGGAEPYGWEKASSPPKPRQIDHFYGGDGEGWNSVKDAKHEAMMNREEAKKPVAKDEFQAKT